jgi:hypothetical protein
MSSKVIYMDTDQPNLVAALINYYVGAISIDLRALSAKVDTIQLGLPQISQGNWYCWYTYVDTRAGLDDESYRKVLFALSKVKHLINQLFESNSNSDEVWCLSSDPAIDTVINTPLEPSDMVIQEQLKERLRISAKVIDEVNQLYARNVILMSGWKGWLLRLLGIRLPCQKSNELSMLSEKN